MALSYGEYLQLDRILEAQQMRSVHEHDEMLFIIIHQTYELWFKQLLHEGGRLAALLADRQTHASLATMGRILVIMKTIVQQTDILETMSPLSFASFRQNLEQSSGFQSLQFRKLEFLMGFKCERKVKSYPAGSQAHTELATFLGKPSLYDTFLHFVSSHAGFALPPDILTRDVALAREGSDERVVAVFLRIYQSEPMLALLCEKFVDLDEGFQEWRYRHVKMVERTIGAKPGTGGSAGVEYLRKSLFRPAFPDRWAVRSYF